MARPAPPDARGPRRPSPPRLAPGRALPPYAYVPGETPHPTRDPAGHGFGHAPETPAPPDPRNWRASADYLYGIDLFNHGFYWEAHEAWEGLWAASGREGTQAVFLQALINLAAAGFKARWGNARGLKANAGTAAKLFRRAEKGLGPRRRRYMGLDVAALAAFAEALAQGPPPAADPDRPGGLRFDLVLRPG